MSYLTQDEIAQSASMLARVSQAAVGQDVPDKFSPDQWAADQRRIWAAAPGWDAAWESSHASHPDDDTWDPGTDEAVITDGMILAQIQSMLATPEK